MTSIRKGDLYGEIRIMSHFQWIDGVPYKFKAPHDFSKIDTVKYLRLLIIKVPVIFALAWQTVKYGISSNS